MGSRTILVSADLAREFASLAPHHGREDSFKLLRGRLLAGRILLGVPCAHVQEQQAFALAESFGLPAAARALLAERWPQANAVFFASEQSAGAVLFKMYLEFWDQVRRAVRGGEHAPQLLHLGVKWSSAQPGRHEEAHYMVHPLLGLADQLRRMKQAYADDAGASALAIARSIVTQAAQHAPDAGFLYLEVSEAGNPRRSFDINLYKSGLRVAAVAAQLRDAAAHFGIAPEALAQQLRELGARPLGHLSGGRDRRGEEFLSVYAEVTPLPEDEGRNWSER